MIDARHAAAAAISAAAFLASPALAFDEGDVRTLQETGDCIGCDLSDADLFGMDLTRALLSNADLRGADLTGAILYFAIVEGADLTGADLSRADLYGANLRRSTLEDVTMSEARICHTVMPSGQRNYNQCGDGIGGF